MEAVNYNIMFADDITLYRIIHGASDYVALQNDINSVSSCIAEKCLQFDKCKQNLMLIIRKRQNCLPHSPLTINGSTLTQVSVYKYLGVAITSNLSWSPHAYYQLMYQNKEAD